MHLEKMLAKRVLKDANALMECKKTCRSKSKGFPSPPALLKYFFQGFENHRMTWKGVIKLWKAPGVPQPGLAHSSSRLLKLKVPGSE